MPKARPPFFAIGTGSILFDIITSAGLGIAVGVIGIPLLVTVLSLLAGIDHLNQIERGIKPNYAEIAIGINVVIYILL